MSQFCARVSVYEKTFRDHRSEFVIKSTGAFAQCNKKYGKTLCAPPGGTEVSAK